MSDPVANVLPKYGKYLPMFIEYAVVNVGEIYLPIYLSILY